MTQFQCHYESLKVTPDAPAEVIRAAYRSLSQKHHPDKNIGNDEAARVMSRLNFAYSVLSDEEQRKRYDLQILREQLARGEHASRRAAADHRDFTAPDTSYGARASSHSGAPGQPDRKGTTDAGSPFNRLSMHMTGRRGLIAVTIFGVCAVALAFIMWLVRQDRQSMLLLENAAFHAPASGKSGASQEQAMVEAGNNAGDIAAAVKPSGAAAIEVPHAAGSQAAAPAVAPGGPEATGAPPKASEFERLTAMLKSMGLGLHKLDLSTQPPNAKRPPAPAPSAEPERAAVAATASPASPRMAAAAPVAAPATERAREEVERPAPEAKAPAETSRASAAPVANASNSASTASPAARHPVIADTRACAPTYPAAAFSNGESGTVQLALLVGVEGRVVESKVLKSSGHPELDKAARRALSQCKFKFPGNEKPVEAAWANLEYVFSLD